MMQTKGVTFNMADPEQEQLLKFAMQSKNFSGYVKSLIQKDQELKERKTVGNNGIKIKLK